MSSVKVSLYRKMCAISDEKRDKGLCTPEDITRFDNLQYGFDQNFHTLDIYRPKNNTALLPLIVHVHGGGYVYGDSKLYQFYCMNLAQQGFAVINFNYRLAPEHKFPSPLQDLNLVMEWACENANKYRFCLKNVFIAGDSAGAQIASQYGAIYSNPDYANKMEIIPPKFRLAALGLNCGLYDTGKANKIIMKFIVDSYFTKNPSIWGDKINILLHITSAYPPVFIMSSYGDFLASQCKPMANFLSKKGIETVCKLYGNKSTLHVFHLDIRSSLAKQANNDEIEFFRRRINMQ